MSRRSGPPRLAELLLGRLLPNGARDEVLADLREMWEERCGESGRGTADRWYWMQTAAAIAPAILRFGGLRSASGEERLSSSMWRDIGYASTQLRKHPAVGAVAALTLSVGIGATTAIFSVVHGVLIRPLPFEQPDELVMVTSRVGGSELPRFLSGPDFADLSDRSRTLGATAGFLETTIGPMTEVDRPEHVVTTPVTWNLFELLGVEVTLGRGFTVEDAAPVPPDSTAPELPTSALISHDFWVRSFGADPDVIGSMVHIWGGSTEIVGVLPEGFRLVVPPELNIPPDGDIWRAIRSDFSTWSREGRWIRTVGRLDRRASLDEAQRELEDFSSSLRATYRHHEAEGTTLRVASLTAAATEPMKGALLLLLTAVGLVLLIACANVANLLLARGAVRANEMAVRASLGAGRARLVRQLLTESAVISFLGVVGGIGLAWVGVELLHAIRPDDLHRLDTVRVDLPVLVFSILLALSSTVLAGLLPALQVSRAGMSDHFRVRGATTVGSRSRDILVVAEVAISVVLLVGAGLLIRSFSELQSMPLGFEPEQVLTVTATQSSRPRAERQAYEADLIRAARSVPGVRSAGIAFPLPMNGVYDRSAEYAMDGREMEPGAWTTAYFRTVSPSYFETMGLQLLRGRQFEEVDENHDVPIVILDERLADREFQGRDPVGSALWVRGMEGDTLRARIVGVVEYAPQWDHRDARPTMYFPRVFYQSHEVSVVAKVEGDPAEVSARLSAAIRGVDSTFPSDLVPMESFVRDRLARSRFLLILMQLFGLLALGLTAVGLYGVLSYSVRRRRRELGVRAALGARTASITGGVIRTGLGLAAVGVAIGLVGALALGRALRAQLFRVGVSDPTTLVGACALVLTVAALASLVPALRAARVDPVVALQEQ